MLLLSPVQWWEGEHLELDDLVWPLFTPRRMLGLGSLQDVWLDLGILGLVPVWSVIWVQ